MTLNELERRNSLYFAFFHRIRQIFGPIISQWLKIDLHCVPKKWRQNSNHYNYGIS